MKFYKLITILLLCLAAQTTTAQSAFSHTTTNSTGAILNTSIDTMTYHLTQSYDHIAIQPVITKATGTMAGTSILAFSVNGTNYVNTDTMTNANAATNTTIWNKITAAKYIRIITSGATTVTGTTAAKVSASD